LTASGRQGVILRAFVKLHTLLGGQNKIVKADETCRR
jgi:hypothetical protein